MGRQGGRRWGQQGCRMEPGMQGSRWASVPPTLGSFSLKNKKKTKMQKERKGIITYQGLCEAESFADLTTETKPMEQ